MFIVLLCGFILGLNVLFPGVEWKITYVDIFLVTVDLLFTLGPVDNFSVKVLSSQLHVYVVGDRVIMVTGDLV